jgi:hypothetical protein
MLPKVVGEHSHPNCTGWEGSQTGEKGNALTTCPAFSGIKWKCTQVAETPTESSPTQTGRGGQVLLESAGSRMLRGKKVMSRGVFC